MKGGPNEMDNYQNERTPPKEKLIEIVESLKSGRFEEKGNWYKAAELVSEGVREVFSLSSEQLKSNAELGEAGRYIMTKQLPLYMNGERSDVYTRRILRIALAEGDK